jgi:OPA family glycerol-3-phosphate transporter-like MFS transporter
VFTRHPPAGSAAGDRVGDPVGADRAIASPRPIATRPSTFRRAQWRVLVATSVCYLCYYTGRQNFGWAIAGIREDFGLTNTQIGWISGTALCFYAAGQMVSGPLGDRFGGRRLVALGAVLSCLLNWLTSFGQGFWTLIVPWSLNNATQSMGFAPASRLIVNWWGPRERGRAFGVFNFAAGFASALTFAGAILVLGRLPWVWVFRLPVLLMPLSGLVFFLLVRDRPEDAGLSPPVDPGRGTAEGRPGFRESVVARYRAILGNRQFLIASVGFGFDNWGRLGLLVWAPLHFLGPGWRANPGAAWVTLSLPIGMALGALVAGYGADRLFRADHARLITVSLVLASATILTVFFVPRNQGGLGMALLFLAGFFVFGPVSSFTALGPELVDRRAAATAIGFMNAVGYAIAALGDLAIGVTLDVTGRTEPLFLITAAACLCGAFCGVLIGRRRAPQRPDWAA